MGKPSPQGWERRSYYRINKEVILQVMPVDPGITNPYDEKLEIPPYFEILSTLRSIEAESSVLLRSIQSKDRTLANYLRSQDRKIATLAQLLVASSVALNQDALDVSLSEGGIAYLDQQDFAPDTCVHVLLVITHSYYALSAIGKVVYCRTLPKSGQQDQPSLAQIGIEFTHIREGDRQLLAKEVLHKQQEDIRRKRES